VHLSQDEILAPLLTPFTDDPNALTTQ